MVVDVVGVDLVVVVFLHTVVIGVVGVGAVVLGVGVGVLVFLHTVVIAVVEVVALVLEVI